MNENEQNAWENYPAALPKDTILAGRYIIQDVLGQGGFGITYLAEDYQSKIHVAIKEFFPESMVMRQSSKSDVKTYTDERSEYFRFGMQSFIEEAKLLAQLRGNPHIVMVHGYFEENNTAYFVMDYIRGKDFKTYIKEHGGKLSWEETWQIMHPVMEALQAAHQKGIIHRDVAPDNIIITEDNIVKLIVFGAARYSLGERSQSLDVILKPGYTPKEQYLRHGKQGPYTDVYSVAACFYAALCGYLPPESLERMDEDTLVPLSKRGVELPAAAEQAILQGLNVQAEKRFLSMEAFQKALTNPSPVPPVPQPPTPVPPSPKIKKLIFAAAAISTLFLVCAVGIKTLSGKAVVVDSQQDTTHEKDTIVEVTQSETSEDKKEIQTTTLTGDTHLLESLKADEENKLYYINSVNAILDIVCKDDPMIYVKMGIGTAEEAHQYHDQLLDSILIEMLTEELYEQYGDIYRECLNSALTKADYEVAGVEKQGERYEITVQYKPLKYFEAVEEAYRNRNRELMQGWLDQPETAPTTEEDMTIDVLAILYLGMEDALESAQYGKKVSCVVDLESDGEDGLASLFMEGLFDTDKIEAYAEQYEDSFMVRGYDSMHYFYVWDDGDAYLGEWNDNGMQNGKGIYVWSNGAIYAGSFKDGKRNGYGVNIYSDGSRYDGNWKNDNTID